MLNVKNFKVLDGNSPSIYFDRQNEGMEEKYKKNELRDGTYSLLWSTKKYLNKKKG